MGNEEKKNITIADVAEALGVSKTTVSRAISGKGRIGQETRDRVLKYIEEHDYKPNVIAKGLAQSKTYNLCVVMPGDYDVVDLTFFQECLFGIQEIAGIMEYDILLSICKNNDISSLERIISNRKVDGVILMRTFVEDRQIEYLQEKKVPFVTIGSSNYTGVIQIDHNHKSACKELTSIILMKGMKRIALIGGDENHVVTQSRLRGFREAYEKMGEVIDPTMLFLNLDNHVVIDKIVEEVLERKAECILCMDDAVCSRVLKKLREAYPTLKREAIFVPNMVDTRIGRVSDRQRWDAWDKDIDNVAIRSPRVPLRVCLQRRNTLFQTPEELSCVSPCFEFISNIVLKNDL